MRTTTTRMSPRSIFRVRVLLVVLVVAGSLWPGRVESCIGARSRPFAQDFEAADYIVLATVDEVVSGRIGALTIKELLKGKRVAELAMEFIPADGCGASYGEGETWVLFLTGVSLQEGEVEHRITTGGFRIPSWEAEAEDWARARLAAVRAVRDEGLPLLDVRWSVRSDPKAGVCVLEKPVHGEKASGQIEFVGRPNKLRLHVDYRLRDPSDADLPSDQHLILEIGGVPHKVGPEGAWGGTPGAFVAHGSPARYALDSLARVGEGQVRAHLGGSVEAAVGMEGFVSALQSFSKCWKGDLGGSRGFVVP